jgi:hypothetical protein
MTTYHCSNGVFYADTRAYMNGQSFNISGKIVPLENPIRMKAILNKGTVTPIVMDAMDPGRALFNTLVESAKVNEGDVQNVLDNHAMFLQVFKLAAYDSHFTLYLIGETGVYTINTPSAIFQETTYFLMPYETKTADGNKPNDITFGANHEWFTAHISAGVDPVISYYLLFLQFVESGGHIETWKFRMHHGKKLLMRHEFYEEASEAEMHAAVSEWRIKGGSGPVSDMTSIQEWGPAVLSHSLLTQYLETRKFDLIHDDRDILKEVKLPTGRVVNLRESLMESHGVKVLKTTPAK